MSRDQKEKPCQSVQLEQAHLQGKLVLRAEFGKLQGYHLRLHLLRKAIECHRMMVKRLLGY